MTDPFAWLGCRHRYWIEERFPPNGQVRCLDCDASFDSAKEVKRAYLWERITTAVIYFFTLGLLVLGVVAPIILNIMENS